MYVITKTKNLVDYVLTISEKSPKKFRYSLLTKMHTACFETMEYLYEANIERLGSEKRKYYQNKSRIRLRFIGYLAEVGQGHGCFTFKQYEVMAEKIHDCDRFLLAWIKSDDSRIKKTSNKEEAVS